MTDIEASFEELYDAAPCGYLSSDSSGIVIRVNQTFLNLTGFTRDDLLGRRFIDLLSTGSQLFYETRYLPVLQLEGVVNEVSVTFRRADARQFPALINSVQVRGDGGEHLATRTAVFDASARQDYERELLAARRSAESSETRVRILQDATSAFGEAAADQHLFDQLIGAVRTAFDAAQVAVMMPSADGELVVCAGTHPLDAALRAMATRPERTAWSEARVVSMSRRDADARSEPGLGDALRVARVASLSVTPMINDGEPLGVFVSFFGREREFDDQIAGLQLALGRLAAQALSRMRLRRELERLAFDDQLTGLANRRLAYERLETALARGRRSGSPLAVIFADLDGFKAINDSLGHAAGDEVLIAVSDRLRSELRETDLLARFGGDEFVVICEDTDEASAREVTERLRSRVSKPLQGAAKSFGISASIGVAVFDSSDAARVSSDALFEAADSAMYDSKAAGKNRVTLVRL